MSKHEKEPDFRHHEDVKGFQDSFVKEVKSLRATIEEMDNPLMESSVSQIQLRILSKTAKGSTKSL